MTARKSGWIYFFAHLATETACFFWLYQYLTTSALWALSYDILVFIPQLFVGMYADRHPALKMGPIGLAVMGAVLALSPLLALQGMELYWRIPMFLLLTVGNCMVHIAGAEATARGAEGRMGPSGIFVGGGSFGLITGRLLGAANRPLLVMVPMVLLAVAFVMTNRHHDPVRMAQPANGFRAASLRPVGTVCLLAFLTVAVRAYIGYAIPTAWIQNTRQLVILYVFMGIGKMLGGVAADWFGARRTAVISLALALPLLIVGAEHMMISLLGVLLFSMTMAISFGILLSLFPAHPGFAFGITTCALSIGTMPAFFIQLPDKLWNNCLIIVLTFAAIVCFFYSSSNHKGGKT